MRNAFIKELVLEAEINEKIALIVGDLGYSVVESFAEKFPGRFINAGVAEQNMIGIAAGMASEGYQVFIYSIANFPTFRCAEQIRNDLAYHKLPITIVAVGAGLSYGNLGYSHHAIQDYGLMRMFPDMLIVAPSNKFELSGCMSYIFNSPQPSYLRLNKEDECIGGSGRAGISPGDWQLVIGGSSNGEAIICTGATQQAAFAWREKHSMGTPIFSLPMWGMAYKKQQVNYLKNYKIVTTFEDHLLDAGFGSWMLEAAASMGPCMPCQVNIKALDAGVCGVVGKQSYLNQNYGLGS